MDCAHAKPDAGNLIGGWELEMVSPPCHPGADTWNAKAHLDADIGEALGYLNAALEGATLNAAAKVLLYVEAGRKYAFRPREISAAPVKDCEEGRAAIEHAVEIVNDVWQRRDEIQPDFSPTREPPGLLEIYALLPRTNCGVCGQATCMAYATDLREGAADLAACKPLSEAAHKDNRRRLVELLGEDV